MRTASLLRFSGIPPNRATSSCLPSRSTRASKHVRIPSCVSILALCFLAIFDTEELCLAARVRRRTPVPEHPADETFDALGSLFGHGGAEATEEGVQWQRGQDQPLELLDPTASRNHPGTGSNSGGVERLHERAPARERPRR